MILSPEEQLECREEIDYLIETNGYEYVWGQETAMDKTKGLLRDAPGKIIDGLNRVVTNPTVVGINEKLKAHAQKINAQDEQRRNEPQTQPSRNQQGNRRQQSKPEHPAWQKGFSLDSDDHL